MTLASAAAPPRCEEEGKSKEDEDDDDFDYSFAKPPVIPAPMDFQFSTRVCPGVDGARPTAGISASSTFSLPVERSWPRDTLTEEQVASSMRDTLADRLLRWTAEQWGLELHGAPLPLRGLKGWPQAKADDPPATLRWRLLSISLPPLLTVRQLEGERGAVQFELGGIARGACLHVSCDAVGCAIVVPDGEGSEDERLDLRLETRLTGLPVAGRAWALVGCGGQWWFERVRLPCVRDLLRGFHEMVHAQMMLHYVAALRS